MNTVETLAGQTLARAIKHRALELGFDLVGITASAPSVHRDFVRRWLDEGRAGSMKYLEARFNERLDPARYAPGSRSVICVAINYYVEQESPAPAAAGKIARYALGDDYHDFMKDRLYRLADWLRDHSACETRCSVDTAPVLERELAARAGIGWVGKNTCVINPRIGSWLLLGELFTSLELPPDEAEPDHCGTCTRCIDACPTQAITAPYELDPRRCISYLTIEHREEIPAEFHQKIGNWVYGCDICQDVCPHNGRAPSTTDPALQPRFPSGAVDVDDCLAWDKKKYRTALKGSAIRRVKLPMFQRNARIAAANRKGLSG